MLSVYYETHSNGRFCFKKAVNFKMLSTVLKILDLDVKKNTTGKREIQKTNNTNSQVVYKEQYG